MIIFHCEEANKVKRLHMIIARHEAADAQCSFLSGNTLLILHSLEIRINVGVSRCQVRCPCVNGHGGVCAQHRPQMMHAKLQCYLSFPTSTYSTSSSRANPQGSMPASTRYTLRSLRTPVQRTQWQRICLRQYATDGLREPAWFQTLREEMLGRTLPPLLDEPTRTQEWKLMKTLSSFVPPEWTRFSGPHSTLPLGHHLAYFNPATPSDKLLPDGTDTYHSPGEPYVRRMWAGGKLRMKVDRYYDKHVGWLPDTRFVCSEHIKDVQLRGSDDTAKIFVTIERRFARERSLRHAVKHAGERHERRGKINALSAEAVAFARQARESEDEDWGDASLVEERHLVFMKERSAAETEAIKEGRLAQTKYLQRQFPYFLHYRLLMNYSTGPA